MMSEYYPLFSENKIWKLNPKDFWSLKQPASPKKNLYEQIAYMGEFQERCSWAIIKLTSKLFKIELSLNAAIFKWSATSDDPLGVLLHHLTKHQVGTINKFLTTRQPWLLLTSDDILFSLRWLETVLVVLRFNPIRVRFPDDKFCPTLHTLDLLRICAMGGVNGSGTQLLRLFDNLRSGCKQIFQTNDLLFVDPLEYLISVDQDKYKDMIKWVSIADGMRSSFMQLLHFQTVQEESLDKLYAWIYKICLFMQMQNIWTLEEMAENLNLLWVTKHGRAVHFE